MKSTKSPGTKAAKKKPNVRVKDLKPRKSPKGGIALLVPAVQKARIL